jgi:hypothetical protein
MPWYTALAYLAAGILLANGFPHFFNGISGRYFQSPFASPPGFGESPPIVNVLWGFSNFVAAYLLITGVGDFNAILSIDILLVGTGILLASLFLAYHFGQGRVRANKSRYRKDKEK